jgi:predicted SAM-dependent methyltransferase
MKLLNLGCGRRYRAGWVNVDFTADGPGVIAANLLQGVPFEDNTFDGVYHSHVLEHFTEEDGTKLIAECWRVLKPGGGIRVVVPDLEKLARWYLAQLELATGNPDVPELAANHKWTVLLLLDQATRHNSGGEMIKFLGGELINEKFVLETCGVEMKGIIDAYAAGRKNAGKSMNSSPTAWETQNPKPNINFLRSFVRKFIPAKKNPPQETMSPPDRKALEIGRFRTGGEVHRWMYDRYSLSALLQQTGFDNVVVRTAEDSFIPDWISFHLDTEPDGTVYKPESLFVEARKKA